MFLRKGLEESRYPFELVIILLSLCPSFLCVCHISGFFFYKNKNYLQVLEDLRTIWNWVLTEKLHINPRDRGLYSAILVLGETFDNRGISPYNRILGCKVGSPVYEVHLYVLVQTWYAKYKRFIHFLLIIDHFLGFVCDLIYYMLI